MKRRWWRWAVLAAVLGVAVADTAVWWWTERALARGVERWRGAMAASGISVGIGTETPGGWPLAATRALAAVELRSGSAVLRVDRAVLRLSALQPEALTVALPGAVAAELPALPPLLARARTWTLALPLHGPAAVDATDMQVEVEASGAAPRALTIALGHLQVGPAAAGGTSLVGSAQSIGLPVAPGETWPLGPRVASVAFDLTLHGSIAPPFLTQAAIAAWRRGGGALAIDRFALGYGPLGLSGAGQFELDQALQPEGRASLHLVGQTETVQALVAGRVISPHVALAANAVLALLATTPPGGGAPQVDTTLVLREGILTVAGFPLSRLPAIAWPTAF